MELVLWWQREQDRVAYLFLRVEKKGEKAQKKRLKPSAW
jgi:hypothetical protein